MPTDTSKCLRAKGLAGAEAPAGEPAAVLVQGGYIRALGRAALEAEAEQEDLTDLWLTPAPIDTHVHLRLGGKLEDNLRAAHEAGICAVRDLGHSLKTATPQNRNGAAPLVFASGPGLGTTGEGGSWLAEKLEGPEQMATAVDRRAGQGAKVIKLFASGLLDFENPGRVLHEKALSLEEMSSAVERARRHGLPVSAHVNGEVQVRNAVNAGVDSIEHGFFMSQETLGLLAERRTFWAPTVGAVLGHARDQEKRYDQAARDKLWRIVDMQTESLRQAERLGVRLVAGTDAGSYGMGHGTALYTEIKAWLEVGIKPYTVYEAVAKQAGKLLNSVETMGVISVGARDFILGTVEDPRENPLTIFEAPFRGF